jgi:hypothetical protein
MAAIDFNSRFNFSLSNSPRKGKADELWQNGSLSIERLAEEGAHAWNFTAFLGNSSLHFS